MPGNKIPSNPSVTPNAGLNPPPPVGGNTSSESAQAFGRKTSTSTGVRGFLKKTWQKLSLNKTNRSLIGRRIKSMFSALWRLFRGRKVAPESKMPSLRKEEQARGVLPEYQGLVKSPPTLKKHRKGEMLGKGSFGSVSLVTNKRRKEPEKPLDKVYVEKTQKIPANNAHRTREINSEVRLQRESPSAPEIYEEKMGKPKTGDDGKQYQEHRMIMEYGGASLSKLMQSWMPAKPDMFNMTTAERKYWKRSKFSASREENMGLPLNLARNVSLQLMSHLIDLHAEHKVHRDLKPDNILIDHKGKVSLADFGLATQNRPQPGEDPENTVISSVRAGSRLWMAPEVMAKKPYGTKVDIWSAGMVLLELLTGERIDHYLRGQKNEILYNPSAHVQLLQFIQDDPRLNPEAKSLIRQMVDEDPMKRPTAIEVLNHPFFQQAQNIQSASYADLQSQHLQAFSQLAAQEQLLADIEADKAPEDTPDADTVRHNISQLGEKVLLLKQRMSELDHIDRH
ncbi:serine/threonine-protein kinase [Endozoicomonadaceae bacterium StTr2]